MIKLETILRALLVVSSGVSPGCGRSTPATGTDAGHAAPKIVHPRVTAPGETPADLARSKVTATIIKDRDAVSPVIAAIALRDGAIALDGPAPSARFSIDLDTFDSGIPLRNERVRNIFFETSGLGWDTAELVVGPIPKAVVDALAKEKRAARASVEGTLKVHGHASKIAMVLDAGYGEGGRLWVKSATPVEVKISDFALTDNLRRLSAICMHDSIDDVVKVDVSVEFSPH